MGRSFFSFQYFVDDNLWQRTVCFGGWVGRSFFFLILCRQQSSAQDCVFWGTGGHFFFLFNTV